MAFSYSTESNVTGSDEAEENPTEESVEKDLSTCEDQEPRTSPVKTKSLVQVLRKDVRELNHWN